MCVGSESAASSNSSAKSEEPERATTTWRVVSEIAAVSLAHNATLATRNVRDFEGLDLKIVNPFEANA